MKKVIDRIIRGDEDMVASRARLITRVTLGEIKSMSRGRIGFHTKPEIKED